ncbi:Gfo/Idh/MocA family oxidoreductase [Patescibacteria group bacterium]|nr:Gfo/Idh/MocA family oxidoreductase [Patescibacteria group bacterium]MBU1500002.1 Gfo/Idh/MocA family oxidoreductase [Patescibacteria group bacterium]
MKTYNFLLIGLGHQMQKRHIPDILTCPNATISGVMDINKNALNQTAKQLNVPGFTKLSVALSTVPVDAAIVSLPHNQYWPILKTLQLLKIPVLKEKPLAMNFREAKKICSLTAKSKVPMTINVQRRFINHFHEINRQLKRIGEIFFVEGYYSLYVKDPSEGWRGKKSTAGGGCILDMGYHLVDLLIWHTGLPDSVYVEYSSKAKPGKNYDVEDTALILFNNSKKHLYGHLTISRYIGPKNEYLQFVGSQGIVRLTNQSVSLYRNDGNLISQISCNANSKNTYKPVEYFINILNGTCPNTVSPQKQLVNMAFIEACYQSKKTKHFVNPYKFMEKSYE